MTIIEGHTISEVYKQLCESIKSQGDIVGDTKELRNCTLIINNPSLTNISFPYKQFSERYANAELKWYWSGDNSCYTIGQYAKLWLSLTDDGKTNNSAYGYILFKKYGYNQLEQIIDILKKDQNSRRAILNISDPTLNKLTTKDLQCTVGIQFLIRNGELEETVYMRSNDIYFGLPYDYVFFVTLGKYISEKLNINFSKYIHTATSMHMYLRNEPSLEINNNQNITIDYNHIIGENYEK